MTSAGKHVTGVSAGKHVTGVSAGQHVSDGKRGKTCIRWQALVVLVMQGVLSFFINAGSLLDGGGERKLTKKRSKALEVNKNNFYTNGNLISSRHLSFCA